LQTKLNWGGFLKKYFFLQLVASGAPALPVALTQPCSTLQDGAPATPFAQVRRLIESPEHGLGRPLEEIFAEFDTEPVASGSIAQVHRAVLRGDGDGGVAGAKESGDVVAVKVQHPRIREKSSADARGIELLSRLAGRLFPGFEFTWVAAELRRSMCMETDFVLEAAHAGEARRILASLRDQSVPWHVPPVRAAASSSRVLTADFVTGARIDDLAGIRREGGDPRRVAAAVVRGFAEMLFVHGFVHGDPHPGNLMFAGGKIVLLDHGLYRRFDEDFRASLCRMWRGIALFDAAEVRREAAAMGAGELADILAIVMTGRLLPGGGSPRSQQGVAKEGGERTDSTDVQRTGSTDPHHHHQHIGTEPHHHQHVGTGSQHHPGRSALGAAPTAAERAAFRDRIRGSVLVTWQSEDFAAALEGLPRDLLYVCKATKVQSSHRISGKKLCMATSPPTHQSAQRQSSHRISGKKLCMAKSSPTHQSAPCDCMYLQNFPVLCCALCCAWMFCQVHVPGEQSRARHQFRARGQPREPDPGARIGRHRRRPHWRKKWTQCSPQ
jgi:hypothetical protein